MIAIELLKKIEGFQGLTDEQLSSLQDFCEELTCQGETKLFTEGDLATHLWFVVEGRVDLRFEMPARRATDLDHTVTSVQVKRQDSAAKTLGWSCFVPPFKMRLSAYCVTDFCRIVTVPRDKLVLRFEKDPVMGYKFMSYMVTVVGYRFQQFQDIVANIMGYTLMSGW
ncbi:MAG: Crp/Fnr family transcriptional regulator [Hyphomicrobiales bacterium]